MPLTPDANLLSDENLVPESRHSLHLLDKLFSLNVVHAMHSSNTISIRYRQRQLQSNRPLLLISVSLLTFTYPTDNTRPVSARPASSCTPRILCSRIDETSVGEAFASAA